MHDQIHPFSTATYPEKVTQMVYKQEAVKQAIIQNPECKESNPERPYHTNRHTRPEKHSYPTTPMYGVCKDSTPKPYQAHLSSVSPQSQLSPVSHRQIGHIPHIAQLNRTFTPHFSPVTPPHATTHTHLPRDKPRLACSWLMLSYPSMPSSRGVLGSICFCMYMYTYMYMWVGG
jgi:hypothetical protein